MDDFATAQECYNEAITLYQDIYGETNINVALIRGNLSEAFQRMGNASQSALAKQKAQEILDELEKLMRMPKEELVQQFKSIHEYKGTMTVTGSGNDVLKP